ncbi:hypothetical protein NKDENANG_00387 [Candidatus Entotheonellaceae bacterium PAL068K]
MNNTNLTNAGAVCVSGFYIYGVECQYVQPLLFAAVLASFVKFQNMFFIAVGLLSNNLHQLFFGCRHFFSLDFDLRTRPYYRDACLVTQTGSVLLLITRSPHRKFRA